MQANATDVLQPAYTDPLHYVAMPGAGFGKRAAALLLDWLILLFLVPGMAMISVAVDSVLPLPRAWGTIGFATSVSVLLIAVYTVCYRLGATPGMLAANSRLIRTRDGGRVRWMRSLLRAVSSWAFVASWFWVFNVFIFSDARVNGSSTTDAVVDYTMLAVFAISLV